MSHLTRAGSSTPWYREAFKEGYLDLYGHRDLAEAARAVRFLSTALEIRRDHRVLDLCCGPGRHLFFLGRLVEQAVGLDLSRVLLAGARDHWLAGRQLPHSGASDSMPGANMDWRLDLPDSLQAVPSSSQPRLVLGTMSRLPFRDATFDRAVNLFTSFGYYEEENKNQQVLNELGRVLRVAGKTADPSPQLAIDHINRQAMLDAFRPHSERVLPSGERIVEDREWNPVDRRVTKLVTRNLPAGETRSWRESVRVYEPDEFEQMLRNAGLEPLRRHGDYDGQPWSAKSPRLILLARRL